jgi:hypothetical protein
LKNNWAKVKTPSLIVEEKGKKLVDCLFPENSEDTASYKKDVCRQMVEAHSEYIQYLEDEINRIKFIIKYTEKKRATVMEMIKICKKVEKTIAHSIGMKRKEFLAEFRPESLDGDE